MSTVTNIPNYVAAIATDVVDRVHHEGVDRKELARLIEQALQHTGGVRKNANVRDDVERLKDYTERRFTIFETGEYLYPSADEVIEQLQKDYPKEYRAWSQNALHNERRDWWRFLPPIEDSRAASTEPAS